jgi:hypothetical protein
MLHSPLSIFPESIIYIFHEPMYHLIGLLVLLPTVLCSTPRLITYDKVTDLPLSTIDLPPGFKVELYIDEVRIAWHKKQK